MELSSSTSNEQHSDSPQRGRSSKRDKSQSRSASTPAQRSGILSLSSDKNLAKRSRFNPRNSANSSESESNYPCQQPIGEMAEIKITAGHCFNPGYVSTKKNTPIFKATDIKQIKNEIWKVTYKDATEVLQSIHIRTYMSPLDYSYWIKDTFCIDLSLPKTINEFFTKSIKMKSEFGIVMEIKQTSGNMWQVSYNDENGILQSVPAKIDQDETGFIYNKSIHWSLPNTASEESDITPKSRSMKRPIPKKSAPINHKIVGIGILAAFIIAILYRDNRLPDFSYYIVAFNALLKGSGART